MFVQSLVHIETLISRVSFNHSGNFSDKLRIINSDNWIHEFTISGSLLRQIEFELVYLLSSSVSPKSGRIRLKSEHTSAEPNLSDKKEEMAKTREIVIYFACKDTTENVGCNLLCFGLLLSFYFILLFLPFF